MNFLEFKDQLENEIAKNYKFDMLELRYMPYAFGSGLTVYRISGKIVKIVFDGKNNQFDIMISQPHAKYPNAPLLSIFSGQADDILDKGLSKLYQQLSVRHS
jgi:hypothetical protein